MKKAVTFRFDAALVGDARRCAVRDNRTLTDFIETLAKAHVASHDTAHVAPREPNLTVQRLLPAS